MGDGVRVGGWVRVQVGVGVGVRVVGYMPRLRARDEIEEQACRGGGAGAVAARRGHRGEHAQQRHHQPRVQLARLQPRRRRRRRRRAALLLLPEAGLIVVGAWLG